MAERRESLPAHPLFPSLGDEPPPRVESIHVTRLEGGRPVYYVRRFGPDELTGLDQIAERFGGGLYELVAYASAGISARRKYELPGRSRPMHEDPSGATADTAGPVLAAPAAAAAPAGGDASFMLGLLQLQAQQNQSMMALMMQGQQESTKALASIVGAALSNRGGGDDVAALLMKSADRQFELMSKLLGGREVSGSSAVALLERGVKLGREFADAAGDDEEDEAEAIEGHIDAVGRMMGQVQALAGGDAAGGGLFGTAPAAQTGAPEPPDVDSGAE